MIRRVLAGGRRAPDAVRRGPFAGTGKERRRSRRRIVAKRMSGLLVLVLVVIVLGAVGNGFRGILGMLGSLLRSGGRSRGSSRQGLLVPGIICIVIGAFGSLATVFVRNGGVAAFAAIMLGIGLPMLILSVYRSLGISMPPLYAWVLVAGIVISPFGLLAWYAALIAAEIILAGLLLLWFDRKDRIMDVLGAQNGDPAQEQMKRLRRTALVLAALAGTVALTAASAAFVWLWFIVLGVAAAYFMVRKIKATRRARAEEQAARDAEVDRILSTKVPGLDDEDDELLRRYLQPNNVPLRKGERLTVADTAQVEIRLTGSAPGGDLGCYVFLLDGQSRVRSDDDLVFFGQPCSPDGSVRVVDGEAGPGADISLSRIPAQFAAVAVAFALGVDAPAQATWTGGTLMVETAGDTYTFPLPADGKTRSVNALRLYRREGGWKLWVTDNRSFRGIDAICDEYGVDVA